MIVTAKVKGGAYSDSIVFDEDNNTYLISVRARPIEGEANIAVINLLAKQLNISKTELVLKSGKKSRIKRFEY